MRTFLLIFPEVKYKSDSLISLKVILKILRGNIANRFCLFELLTIIYNTFKRLFIIWQLNGDLNSPIPALPEVPSASRRLRQNGHRYFRFPSFAFQLTVDWLWSNHSLFSEKQIITCMTWITICRKIIIPTPSRIRFWKILKIGSLIM